jgi:integrase
VRTAVTDAGRRAVTIPPDLLPDLTVHLDHYVSPDDDALVFTGEKGGPLRPHVLQKAWVRAKEAVGAGPLHLHDLRHAGNTWAEAAGASTGELIARMGHTSSGAALRYQHTIASGDRAIALPVLARTEKPSGR